ncbi:MAG: hypothetical protein LBR47_04125 [Spirochaetaceae bacterium]|jgi:hypothetical protein|nr:hypothetical protein [Spirochaetaceae bacterium]
MNDDNTAGFTFIETLFSVTLILLLCAAAAGAFVSSAKGNESAFTTLRETYTLLDCDRKLRERIEPTVLPYWQNSIPAAYLICDSIIDDSHIPGVEILNAVPLIKNRAAHGISVTYRILPASKQYTCNALFASAGDAVDR